MRRLLSGLWLSWLLLPNAVFAAQTDLATRLSGRILLQVQAHGEAWYVDPVLKGRLYLGKSEDAYRIMRERGLGIRHSELARYLQTGFPKRLSGRILLDVESRGEAYYINPLDLRGIYMGKSQDAYILMRNLGLGIKDSDLAKIKTVGQGPIPEFPSVSRVPATETSELEAAMHSRINAYRKSKGLAELVWSSPAAVQARLKSENIASGGPFSHIGFDERVAVIEKEVQIHGAGENLAYTNDKDPVSAVFQGWIDSPGHRANIESPSFNRAGLGVAKNGDFYYFTQIFLEQAE